MISGAVPAGAGGRTGTGGRHITAFRLQTSQKLLYSYSLPWTDTACLLLGRAGHLGLDKHLFLFQPQSADFTGLTSFYPSVLQAWHVFMFQQKAVETPGVWLFEEPVWDQLHLLSGPVICHPETQRETGIVKLGHLLKTSFLGRLSCSTSAPTDCCSGWWKRSVPPCRLPSECFLKTVLYLTNGMMNMDMFFLPWLSLLLWGRGRMQWTPCCLLGPQSWGT